ncbi:hypothetical protein [Wolbachia endosymbiont (group A) of Cydia splendana]|nr:hypothetical protein [Wolbachia endosymbiont (group A) of Cydia splendana]
MSVATRFFQLLCNKAIPVLATCMTPFFFLDPSGLCCIASYDG